MWTSDPSNALILIFHSFPCRQAPFSALLEVFNRPMLQIILFWIKVTVNLCDEGIHNFFCPTPLPLSPLFPSLSLSPFGFVFMLFLFILYSLMCERFSLGLCSVFLNFCLVYLSSFPPSCIAVSKFSFLSTIPGSLNEYSPFQ